MKRSDCACRGMVRHHPGGGFRCSDPSPRAHRTMILAAAAVAALAAAALAQHEIPPYMSLLEAAPRQLAMGGTGVALADDHSVALTNCAGLGLHNDAWEGGAALYALAPAADPDTRGDELGESISRWAVLYQPSRIRVGGVALDYTGDCREITQTTPGPGGPTTGGTLRYWHIRMIAAYGTALGTGLLRNHHLGLVTSLNYQKQFSVAGDVQWYMGFGYLWALPFGLRVGFSAPTIVTFDTPEGAAAMSNHQVYRYGIAFDHDFVNSAGTPLVGLAVETTLEHRYDDAIDYGRPEDATPGEHRLFTLAGVEVELLRTFALRAGVAFDENMHVDAVTIGSGIHVLRHATLDFAFRLNPGSTYRDTLPTLIGSGTRFSLQLSIERLFRYSRLDLRWWEAETANDAAVHAQAAAVRP